MLPHFFVLLLACCLSYTLALVNVTVDDFDPSILYQPPEKWQAVSDSSCSGGGYSIGHDSCVNATIQCNWVSFYYLSPRWPFPIATEISIDGGAPTTVDLQDHSAPVNNSGPSTGGSTVAFSYHGTESKLHTILVSGSAENPYAVVDALIFETIDGGTCYRNYGYGGNNYSYSYGFTQTNTVTTTTTTTQTLTTPTYITTGSSYSSGSGTAPPSTYSSPPPVRIVEHSNHGLIIGISILGAILALLLLLLLLFLIWRRRRHPYPGPPGPGSSQGSLNPTYGAGEGGTGTYGGAASTTYGGAATPVLGAAGGIRTYGGGEGASTSYGGAATPILGAAGGMRTYGGEGGASTISEGTVTPNLGATGGMRTYGGGEGASTAYGGAATPTLGTAGGSQTYGGGDGTGTTYGGAATPALSVASVEQPEMRETN